jgi:hypothetical protein
LATLEQPVDLRELVEKHGEGRVSLTVFLRAHPDGVAHVWAMNNNHIGQRSWPALQPNDLVIFYGNGRVYAYGFLSAKVYWHSNDYLWPTSANWDFIYSLRDFHVVPEGSRPRTGALRDALSNFAPSWAQLHEVDELGTTARSVFTALFPDVAWPGMPSGGAVWPPVPTHDVLLPPPPPGAGPLGRTGPAPRFTTLEPQVDAVTPNWQARERGTLAHQQVVLQLHQLIARRGCTPYYGDPEINFDISWTGPEVTYVVEVKSLTADNEADQIRLGLGQVLDYHWTYCTARPHMTVKAVLVTELAPQDPRWVLKCAAAGVLLTWPDRMADDLGL